MGRSIHCISHCDGGCELSVQKIFFLTCDTNQFYFRQNPCPACISADSSGTLQGQGFQGIAKYPGKIYQHHYPPKSLPQAGSEGFSLMQKK